MNHDIIVIDDKEYQAVKDIEDSCKNCALYNLDCLGTVCDGVSRSDNTNVVYKRKIKIGEVL